MTMNYTTLIGLKSVEGSIRAWGKHTSIPADSILTEAQAWIYEQLRAREMLISALLTGTEGDTSIALPDDFLDPIGFRLDGDGEDLPYVEQGLLGLDRDTDGENYTGQPSRWTILYEEVTFDVELDADLIGTLIYYGRPDDLAADNLTNFLTRRFPSLLRHACTAFAYEDRGRSNDFKTELQLAQLALDRANMTADMARRGQIT